MEQLNRLALHQRGGNCGGLTFTNDALKLGNTLPIAVIIKEASLFVVVQVLRGRWARVGHVAVHASAQCVHVIGKQPLDEDHAVPLKGVNLGGGKHRMCHSATLALPQRGVKG